MKDFKLSTYEKVTKELTGTPIKMKQKSGSAFSVEQTESSP